MIGTWINSNSCIMAEIASVAGFDFVTVDAEHAPLDTEKIHSLFQAIRSGSHTCKAFIRTPGSDYDAVKRYMDAGADGVICPLVNSAVEAEELVSAVKYPPFGKRGLGFCRDNGYGKYVSRKFKSSNSETFVFVQIEHVNGVDNIDEILTVKGINGVFIGPYDLTASLGIAGEFDNPLYLNCRDKVFAACQKKNLCCGIHVVQPDLEQLKTAVDQGYDPVAYSLDITMVLSLSEKAVQYYRDLLGK